MEKLDFSTSNVVLESADYIVSKAVHVGIHSDVLKEYAETISLQKIDHWMVHAPIDLSFLSPDQMLAFMFVFNSLSFSYWGNPDYFFVHENKTYKTSWGLIVALCAAIKKDRAILDIDFLSTVSNEFMHSILNSNCIFPMFEERCDIIRSNARVVKEKFKGDIGNIIEQANHDAGKMINLLYMHFPSYRDESDYSGRKVFFMKKAQILIADICRGLSSSMGNFTNIGKLTACADYRLPQLMRHLGILTYSEELGEIVDTMKVIEKNSVYESEIRGSTIKVNEEIRKILEKKFGQEVTAIDVNDFLWISAKTTEKMKPYHLVRTTMY